MTFDRQRADFGDVVQTYGPQLYRYARRLCRDPVLAEDLVQDTLVRAWKAWTSLRDGASVKFWLLAILRNENYRHYSRGRLLLADADVESIEIPVAEGALTLREVLDLVEELPVPYREPLLLQVFGGFTCHEIARALNVTEGAVMTRLSRARRALRTRLVEHAARTARSRPTSP